MKKTIAIVSSLGLYLSCFVLVYAQPISKFKNPLKLDSTQKVLEAFLKILIQIGAVAVTLAIVYAGFLFVVAQGNPEKINTAKKTLFYTIIGALILLGAQIISSVVQSTITQLS